MIFSSCSFFLRCYSYFFSRSCCLCSDFCILRSDTCKSTFKIERSLIMFWYMALSCSILRSRSETLFLYWRSSGKRFFSRALYASLISSSSTSKFRLRSILDYKNPLIWSISTWCWVIDLPSFSSAIFWAISSISTSPLARASVSCFLRLSHSAKVLVLVVSRI